MLVLLCFAAPLLKAQNLEEGTGEIEHTGEEVQLDSTLFGRDIFSALPEQVVVRQSNEIRSALNRQVASHAGRDYNGFRIRTYASPNFKVTVGNFRTRLDAEAFLRRIKGDFPDAFIVRERFKYPSIGQPGAASLAVVEP